MRVTSVVIALVVSAAGACSYNSYTPPARMMPLETAVGPARGASDVQGEVSTVGNADVFGGFSTNNGAARLRGGLTDNVSISAEGGMIAVQGLTANPIDHDAYVGRLGVHVHEADRSPGAHVALTAGVGGGTSVAAGNWVSEDAGVILSGNGYWFVPFVSLDGFASQPVAARPFSYVAIDDNSRHDDLLTPSAGWRVTTGFELRDGNAADSQIGVIVGLMLGGVYKADQDNAIAGLGFAFRLAI